MLAAIGDALGWITEFEKSTDSLVKKYNSPFISSFHKWERVAGGRFNGYFDDVSEGSYSDDTQLLLAVARSIKNDGTVDQEYFSKKELPSWLLYARGAGRTIKNAAKKIDRKSARWNNNFFTYKIGKEIVDYRASGANGAAMRILPIALANLGRQDVINEEIFANSIVTHGHPRAIIGAMLYGHAINTILKLTPENFSHKAFLIELGKDLHDKLQIPNKDDFKGWMRQWNAESEMRFGDLYQTILDETRKYMSDAYLAVLNNVNDKETLSRLGCYESRTKSSGLSTVIAGIFLCCKYHDEPIKAIEQAANLIGTDTDSIAAFTGGLVGSLHGASIIPDKFKSVQDAYYLSKVASTLFRIHNGNAVDAHENMKASLGSIRTITDNHDLEHLKLNEKIYFPPLGVGSVIRISRQEMLKNKNKLAVLVDIDFEMGQSCRFITSANTLE